MLEATEKEKVKVTIDAFEILTSASRGYRASKVLKEDRKGFCQEEELLRKPKFLLIFEMFNRRNYYGWINRNANFMTYAFWDIIWDALIL